MTMYIITRSVCKCHVISPSHSYEASLMRSAEVTGLF